MTQPSDGAEVLYNINKASQEKLSQALTREEREEIANQSSKFLNCFPFDERMMTHHLPRPRQLRRTDSDSFPTLSCSRVDLKEYNNSVAV